MAEYSYQAVDVRGKNRKGNIEASDEAQARTLLKKNGLIVLKLGEAGMLTKDISITIGKPVTPRELGIFCRQFQSILHAGVTIIEALKMLGDQTENKAFAKGIRDTAALVEKGETLGNAMRRNPKLFPGILITMVDAGEASGSMEVSFARMATHFEKTAKTKALIKKAMIYPVVLAVVALIVIIVMSVFVFPKFADMFASMGTEMPGITKVVMAISNVLMYRWYFIILVLAILILSVRMYAKTSSGRHVFGSLALKLPVFGKMNSKNACANFSRTFSTLIGSGMSISQSLEITARSMSNILYREALEQARVEVEQGVNLSAALRENPLFPAMVCQMLNIGEETGNVEKMLDKVAEYYEEEVEIQTQSLSAAMEPMIIVVMGIIVMFMVMAIYMPMIQMYSDAGNL